MCANNLCDVNLLETLLIEVSNISLSCLHIIPLKDMVTLFRLGLKPSWHKNLYLGIDFDAGY